MACRMAETSAAEVCLMTCCGNQCGSVDFGGSRQLKDVAGVAAALCLRRGGRRCAGAFKHGSFNAVQFSGTDFKYEVSPDYF